MVRKCIICNVSFKKGQQRSLHRIPSNIKRRNMWLSRILRYLGRNHIPKDSVVCSDHFTSYDFSPGPSGGRMYLKDSAVPELPISSKHNIQVWDIDDTKCSIDISDTQLIDTEKGNFRTQESTTDRNIEDTNCSIDISNSQLNSNEKENSRTQESTTDRLEFLPRRLSESTVSADDPLASDNCTKSDLSDGSSSTITAPETQRILEKTNEKERLPRFFGECSSEDMDNPIKARRTWQIAKKTILRQKAKIKHFRRKTNRLESKVHALNSLVKFLTEKQSLTTAELSMVSRVKETILRENTSDDEDDVIDLVSQTRDEPPSPTQPKSASTSVKVIARENVPSVQEKISELLPNHIAETTKRSERLKNSIYKSKLEDEFTFFGNNIASQLRHLPLEQALISQSEIMSILTEQRIAGMKFQSRSSQCSLQVPTSPQPYYIIPKSYDISSDNSSIESLPFSTQPTQDENLRNGDVQTRQNNSSNSNVIICTL